MTSTALDALKDWHDFHIVIRTAPATLIGAMFIARASAIRTERCRRLA